MKAHRYISDTCQIYLLLFWTSDTLNTLQRLIPHRYNNHFNTKSKYSWVIESNDHVDVVVVMPTTEKRVARLHVFVHRAKDKIHYGYLDLHSEFLIATTFGESWSSSSSSAPQM